MKIDITLEELQKIKAILEYQIDDLRRDIKKLEKLKLSHNCQIYEEKTLRNILANLNNQYIKNLKRSEL